MGADIHLVLEKRMTIPGTQTVAWVGVNAFPYVKGTVYDFSQRHKNAAAPVRDAEGRVHWHANNRNYELFAALAGVRGDGPEPRGIPDDVSVLALHMIEGWGEDGHSHTWMLMDEALPLFLTTGQLGSLTGTVIEAMKSGSIEAALTPYMEHFWNVGEEDSLSDFRLIAWFDN
jgi:hypothetical protein